MHSARVIFDHFIDSNIILDSLAILKQDNVRMVGQYLHNERPCRVIRNRRQASDHLPKASKSLR